jgi:tRNA1(Val) A37 N6-methylase TrmN6
MDVLGRYYTANLFSSLLVSNITIERPNTILELGVGDGSLLKAAIDRWIGASFFATDIDSESVDNILTELPFVNIFHANSLSSKLSNKIKINVDSVDVAICNPPYLRLKSLKPYVNLFDSAKLPLCSKMNFVTSDVVFLAQNLTLLKRNGQLGIILPDSLISGKEFVNFRKTLLENHKVSKIIQLPEHIFPKTEALTHILFIEKGISTNSNVNIFEASPNGKCDNYLSVNSAKLVERMDFKYHSHILRSLSCRVTISQPLKTFNAEIRRGSIENKLLKGMRISQLHTTSLVHGCPDLTIEKKLGQRNLKHYVVAEPGDILLARVGRGCIGKVSMVKEGRAVLSDCIYRIRVPAEYRERVFNSFVSASGQDWFKAMSHGVCAKVISKFDLLEFPIV